MLRLIKKRGQSSALILVFLAAIVVAFVFFFTSSMWRRPAEGITIDKFEPKVEQIQRIGQLVVLRITVADILEARSAKFRGAWLVKGDALVAVDMHKAHFSESDVDKTKKKLIVRLPQPKIIQPRVDHERTKMWDIQRTTFLPSWEIPKDFMDEAMRQAQKLIEYACNSEDILELGRQHTEDMLKNMYRLVMWECDIVWDRADDTKSSEPSKEDRTAGNGRR